MIERQEKNKKQERTWYMDYVLTPEVSEMYFWGDDRWNLCWSRANVVLTFIISHEDSCCSWLVLDTEGRHTPWTLAILHMFVLGLVVLLGRKSGWVQPVKHSVLWLAVSWFHILSPIQWQLRAYQPWCTLWTDCSQCLYLPMSSLNCKTSLHTPTHRVTTRWWSGLTDPTFLSETSRRLYLIFNFAIPC